MAELLKTFAEDIIDFRKVERQIGALEYQLKLVDFMQAKGYNALVICDIMLCSTEKE